MKDNLAIEVLEWVEERLARGYDAVWIYKQALERLGRIGLSQNDLNHFRVRVSRLTGVNEE